MKRFNFGMALALGFLGMVSVAKADFIAGRVRTTQEAKGLDQIDENGNVLNSKGADLFAQQTDGKQDFVSFTLTEMVQVECFRAPCPPIKETHNFTVTSVKHFGLRVTVYEATDASTGRNLEVAEESSTSIVSVNETSSKNKNLNNKFEGTFEDLMVTQ